MRYVLCKWFEVKLSFHKRSDFMIWHILHMIKLFCHISLNLYLYTCTNDKTLKKSMPYGFWQNTWWYEWNSEKDKSEQRKESEMSLYLAYSGGSRARTLLGCSIKLNVPQNSGLVLFASQLQNFAEVLNSSTWKLIWLPFELLNSLPKIGMV